MSRKRVALALGLWFVVLVVACGEHLLTPEPAANVTFDTMKAIHPFRPKLRIDHVFVCDVVEYDGSRARHGYRRDRIVLDGPGKPSLVPGSDPTVTLGRYHYVRWSGDSGRMLFEADCILPLQEESAAFALSRLRLAGRSGSEGNGGNPGTSTTQLASGGGGWGDDELECWYDPFDDSLECDGVFCAADGYNRPSPQDAGSGQDRTQGGGGEPNHWACENNCSIWIEGGYFFYSCPWEYEGECDPNNEEHECCCPESPAGSASGSCVWAQYYGGECTEGEGGGGHQLTLTCDEPTLTRADYIACTAAATGGPLTVIKWQFTPDSSGLPPVIGSHTQSVWSGRMLTSGTVTIKALSGSDTLEASQHIAVGARNLAAFGYFEFGTPTVSAISNTNPTQGSHIGYMVPSLTLSSCYNDILGSGPNEGLQSFACFPLKMLFEIGINYDQMQPGSTLANRHQNPQGNECTLSYITGGPMLADVGAHEEMHIQWSKDELENDKSVIQPRAEAFVSTQESFPASFNAIFLALVGETLSSHVARNTDGVHGAPGGTLSCALIGIGGDI